MSESANHEGEDPPAAAPALDDPDEPDAGAEPRAGAEQAKTTTETEAGLLAELLELDDRGDAAVAIAAGPAAPPRLGVRVGRLVEWVSGAAPTVEFEGNERGPLAARSTIALHPTLVAEAIRDQRGVMLTFEDGRADAPIITGLLQPVIYTIEDGDSDSEDDTRELDSDSDSDSDSVVGTDTEARIDGRRVELEAADEIVLRCGKASIVLRRNGRVVIRGTYVETRSRGVNRVKGGSVEIN